MFFCCENNSACKYVTNPLHRSEWTRELKLKVAGARALLLKIFLTEYLRGHSNEDVYDYARSQSTPDAVQEEPSSTTTMHKSTHTTRCR